MAYVMFFSHDFLLHMLDTLPEGDQQRRQILLVHGYKIIWGKSTEE